MKRRTATIALLLCPVAAFTQSATDWIIVPGKRAGPVDAGASEAKPRLDAVCARLQILSDTLSQSAYEDYCGH